MSALGVSRPPFVIVPWEQDFLQALADALIGEHAADLSEVLIIFPHARPARYLRRILAARPDLPKPCLLPAMYALPRFISDLAAEVDRGGGAKSVPSPAPGPSSTLVGWRPEGEVADISAEEHASKEYGHSESSPRQTAHVLDQVAVLREVVLALAEDAKHGGLAAVASDARRFLPWGVRLAGLMEDIFSSGITPGDFSYLDDNVPSFAASLLENLSAIHKTYVLELDRRSLTTPGYDGKLVMDSVRKNGKGGFKWQALQGRRIVLAGFYGLSGVEECLFRHLWLEQGARIFLHTDARIAAAPDEAHWSCAAHAAWLKSWNAAVRVAETPAERISDAEARLTFYQGYDLHSQLTRLHDALKEGGEGEGSQAAENTYESRAAVLLDSGLLMPLLHHLPRKNINISMGYPLERSPLARLVELMLRLQESRREPQILQDHPANLTSRPGFEEGERGGELQGDYSSGLPLSGAPAYHWRGVLNLLRHPYLRMLERDGERPLQVPLGILEKLVRGGARFVSPHTLVAAPEYQRELALAGLEAGPVKEMLARLLELAVTAWEGVATLGGAAQNLAHMAEFLLEEGRDLWPRFPLDGEYLFRLSEHLAPQLAQSAFAQERLDQEALFALLREAVRGERVPFEAEPLEGLQVLGMLETRLLSFERVLILDATDDRLPGAPAYDPLLPDVLRREMGLPGLAQRELAMAYTFNRLIRAAREVDIFYQSGTGSGGLLDEKKTRSRFVEELIWTEERRRGALLKPGEPPLHNIAFKITPAAAVGRSISKSEAAARRLDAWLQKPVSPTALDVYLQCPAHFFYSRLAGLVPPDVVREGDDPAGVGDFLHAVLQEFFEAYAGAQLPGDFPRPEDERRMAGIYLEKLEADIELAASLPYASYLMLKTTGLARIMGLLRQTPPGTGILDLETTLEAPLTVNGRTIILRGKLDRVDLRQEGGEHGEMGRECAGEVCVMILDYKSGRVRESRKQGFWAASNPLWRAMAEWSPDMPAGAIPGGDVLSAVAEGVKSLQLPVYMYLQQCRSPELACHAAFVDLARSGEEKALFPAALLKGGGSEVLRELYAAYIPALPAFVLRHMLSCREFAPQPGGHCAWCPYQTLCRRRV